MLIISKETICRMVGLHPEVQKSLDRRWEFMGYISFKGHLLRESWRDCSGCRGVVPLRPFVYLDADALVIPWAWGVCPKCSLPHWAMAFPPYERARGSNVPYPK